MPEPYHSPVESNVPYLVAVVVMAALGLAAVMTIFIVRPDTDNTALIATVTAMIVPTTVAILTFMKTRATHLIVNGRMEEFRRVLEEMARQNMLSAHAEGVVEGRQTGRAESEARTDTLTDQADKRAK